VTATAAVKVTDSPWVEWLVDTLTVVLVVALATVCVTAEAVLLPMKLASPLCEAVTLWVPTLSADVVHVATLVLAFTGWAEQPLMMLAPSLNSTVPPGLPPDVEGLRNGLRRLDPSAAILAGGDDTQAWLEQRHGPSGWTGERL
jgi:hypothetical protein